MLSRQTETNRNMTIKNKVSAKKRKNDRIRPSDKSDIEEKVSNAEAKQNETVEQNKNNKYRGRNRSKKDTINTVSGNTSVRVSKNSKNPPGNNGDVTSGSVDKDSETSDVVLRKSSDASKRNTNAVKRYSDSFVIENGQDGVNNTTSTVESNNSPPTLTRAVSGFFNLEHARKTRRFSDLFRTSSTMKLTDSTENLKSNENNNIFDVSQKNNYNKKVNKDMAKKNSNSKIEQKKNAVTKAHTLPNKENAPNTEPSYLKRVRSKIYKSKNDTSIPSNTNDTKKIKTKKNLDINSQIPENEVMSTLNGLRKSVTSFDFKLIRQTSNLEGRPKTYTSEKSGDTVDGAVKNDKPILAKSKSSSAINLNLLRSRRNKLMEQVASKFGMREPQSEFDFIAFGSVNNVSGLDKIDVYGSQHSLQKQPSWLHIHKEETAEDQVGDVNLSGQPVSRSGSDRRSDVTRDDNFKQHDSSGLTSSMDTSSDTCVSNMHEKQDVALDSSTILPATGSSRKVNSNINRSESVKEQSERRKQRRNYSDPSHNTSGKSDLDHALSTSNSGASSNSSISCNDRLSESPSNSVDVVAQSTHRRTIDSESDMDAEAEAWHNLVNSEDIRNLPPHEKKRQDVINELFHTEGSHVRNLKVLYKIFYQNICESQTLKPDELCLLFPNIKEVLDVHMEINKEMRNKRKGDPFVKELGNLLLEIFDERRGEQLKRAAAAFCERQQLALEFIKKRRERDSKFDLVLTECEKKRQCRRLPFQGILPTEMQRLSKYPLLLERLIHSIESSKSDDPAQQEELAKLKRAHHISKEILNYVNEAAKVAHNRHRLEEIQKHLDTSSFERSEQPIAQEFRTIDLTKYKLVIEGGMQLRRPNKAIVPVHILLLEEAVVILHREGDKFLLKFFQSGSSAQPSPLSPIIKMNTLLVRTNAVCKNALFLVSTSTNNSQMYDLMAEDEIKREIWFKHFSDAIETYNRREGKACSPSQRLELPLDDSDDSASEVALDISTKPEEIEAPQTQRATEVSSSVTQDSIKQDGGDSSVVDQSEDRSLNDSPEMSSTSVQTKSAEEWPLIQPTQVNIAVPPVHRAESMLTPLEQIKRKDTLIKEALKDKEDLVADLLNIPREDFRHIADLAGTEVTATGEPSERLLACIFQVDQLQKAVNESMDIGEQNLISLKGGKYSACPGQIQPSDEVESGNPFTIPATFVKDTANSLSLLLTTVLGEVKAIEEERDRLRKELHRIRERLHEENNIHSSILFEDNDHLTSSTSCASEQCTLNDSIQIISKSDCEDQQ